MILIYQHDDKNMSHERGLIVTYGSRRAKIIPADPTDPDKLVQAYAGNLAFLEGRDLRYEEEIAELSQQITEVQTNIAYEGESDKAMQEISELERKLRFARLDRSALRIEVF